MRPERWRAIETLYHAACERRPEERRAFIESACSGDESLRLELQSLIDHEQQAANFLESRDARLEEDASEAQIAAGQRIGPYVVLEFLRAGGMGEVYKGVDPRLERTVAIKFLPRAFADDPAALNRFRQEARAASALNDPRICTVYDVGEHEGRPYFVMEFLDGQSLQERISGRPLPVPELLDYGAQVADALGTAHSKGIVHRDVKPANIFVTSGGQIKVLDFGLAKRSAERRQEAVDTNFRAAACDGSSGYRSTGTRPGGILGTLAYLSPEQAAGKEVDVRTDIYSLGVVLYEMATGRPVFRRDTTAELLRAIAEEEPLKPTVSNPGTPAALERIILKAVEKDRDARYSSMGELRADLLKLRRSKSSRPLGARRFISAAVGALLAVAVGAILLVRSFLPVGNARAVHSIAVLPLQNLSGDPQQDYLVDGLTGLLTGELAKSLPLRVISRNSSNTYRDRPRSPFVVAQELHVEAVLDGTVNLLQHRLRVSVELRRVPSGRQVWAAAYDRDVVDMSTLQREIAHAVAYEIGTASLSTAASPRHAANPEAIEALLRARYYLDRRTGAEITRAVSWFQKAIEADPAYAAAYAGLADCYNQLGTVMVGAQPPSESRKLAKAAASRALEIDPNLAEAHAALAYSNLYDWNWAEAGKGFERAISMNPNYANAHLWYAHFLSARREFSRAQQQVHIAADLDPLSPIIQTQIGWILGHEGRLEEAIAQYRKVLSQYPDFQWALWVLGGALSDMGDHAAAIPVLERAAQLNRSPSMLASLGQAYARAGRRSDAEKLLNELLAASRRGYVPPHAFVHIYLGLGDADKVFEWLEKSYQERSNSLAWLGVPSKLFDPVRSDPRFDVYLQKIGLK